jgi:phosphopantothenoylcysteine decarboxylase/phosphopantothenate--cysteine ligase
VKKTVIVTAGPTREKIDPVRYISNYSTGAFGYAIAAEAKSRGYPVILISGPTELKAPRGVKLIRVESALEMYEAVAARARRAGCIIMAAAVADWRAEKISQGKLKKGAGALSLRLVPTIDIAKKLGEKKNYTLVGFALESGNLEKNAREKLKTKRFDMIIANKAGSGPGPFGDNMTDILLINNEGRAEAYRRRTKAELAKIILDKALRFNI